MDIAKLERLNSRAKQLLREHEAILTLANLLGSDFASNLGLARKELTDANSITKLERYIEQENKTIGDLRRTLGITVPNSDLTDFVRRLKLTVSKIAALSQRHGLWVVKYRLKEWFPNLGRFLPNFDELPNHAKILIRLPGNELTPLYEWAAVEVVLFEDMCALFNSAKQYSKDLAGVAGSKRKGKLVGALIRATSAAAVYFLDAYLNGIAIDFYIDNHKRLDEKDKTLLLERDLKKRRRITVGLRDKILQYPRIILGVKNPPLQETNCPELSFVISTAKQMRDAIAHASSIVEPGTPLSEKEFLLANPDFQQLEQIVDNAIALVRKIETTIRGSQNRLFWLHDRGPDGAFGAQVFF